MEHILAFLTQLQRNNSREWFNANKTFYQESLDAFHALTGRILSGISGFDPTLSDTDPKDAVFRIYKDTRFSKDKTPYKTHFGAWMTRGGRKSTDAGYYFHLEPGSSFMAAGVWMPPKEKLHLIRQEIVFNPREFLRIVRDPKILSRYERSGLEDMLKKGPVGFPKDFEHMDELRHKHVVFSRNYPDDTVCGKNFEATLVSDFQGLLPLVNYLNHAMSFEGNE